MSSPIVKFKEISIVTPASTQEESIIYLSCMDQVSTYYMETVHFYPPSGLLPQQIFTLLQDALSKILVPYNFLAGRFKANHEEKRLEILCNNAGIPFSTATSELPLKDLAKLDMLNPLFTELIVEIKNRSNIEDCPLIAIQVTCFRCGSICIGLTTNHAGLDGIAAAEFMKNYAAIAQGIVLQVVPTFDRTMLRPRSPPCPSSKYQHKEWMPFSTTPSHNWIPISNFYLASSVLPDSVLSEYSFKAFGFTKDVVKSLQSSAMADGCVTKCSSFEAVVAHIWQARTLAMNTINLQSSSSLLFVVDIRNKMLPCLPHGYCGNAILGPRVSVNASEIAANHLSSYVAKIQQAYDMVTHDYVQSSIDFAEMHHAIPSTSMGFMASSWRKVPWFDADFGWGKPVSVTPVRLHPHYLLLLLNQSNNAGELVAYLGLLHHEMEVFEKLCLGSVKR